MNQLLLEYPIKDTRKIEPSQEIQNSDHGRKNLSFVFLSQLFGSVVLIIILRMDA
jgi:hypothetical protein